MTSFSDERLQDLFLHNEVRPAVNQLETHPFFSNKPPIRFCNRRASNMKHGLLSPKGRTTFFNHPVLKEIAARHGKGVGAVVLRWLNQAQHRGYTQDRAQGTNDREFEYLRFYSYR